jgi:SP family sugar:H+ symporter-like MFS transporter
MVPEMKGFSIEQLDFLYDSGVPTLKFKKYRFESETEVVIDGRIVDLAEDGEAVKEPVVSAKKASEADSD